MYTRVLRVLIRGREMYFFILEDIYEIFPRFAMNKKIPSSLFHFFSLDMSMPSCVVVLFELDRRIPQRQVG